MFRWNILLTAVNIMRTSKRLDRNFIIRNSLLKLQVSSSNIRYLKSIILRDFMKIKNNKFSIGEQTTARAIFKETIILS